MMTDGRQVNAHCRKRGHSSRTYGCKCRRRGYASSPLTAAPLQVEDVGTENMDRASRPPPSCLRRPA
jgi:hypothetical protein